MGFIVTKPFEVFNDLKGNPLENGKLFIGVTNLNPKTNPVSVFFDEALTIPADQPIRTIGGYPSQNGTPANIYIENINYSITVDDKNDKFIYSRLDSDNVSDEVLARDIISDLTAIKKASLDNNQQALVGGYNTIGDGGGGGFFWNASSTAPADNVTIFESNEGGTGRWIRNDLYIDVMEGGAIGDGVTDDSAVIQVVFDSLSDGGTAFFPSGFTFRVDTPLTVVGKAINIIAYGATIDFSNNNDLFGEAISMTGSISGASTTATVNIVQGSPTITVASEAGFMVDNWLQIVSDSELLATTATYLRAELGKIKSTAANTITIYGGTKISYDTGTPTVTIDELAMINKPTIYGLTIIGSGSLSQKHIGIRISFAVEPIIRDVSVIDCSSTGMDFNRCDHGLMQGCYVENCNDTTTSTGYGYSHSPLTQFSTVDSCRAIRCRHAFTTGGLTPVWNWIVSNCTFADAIVGAFPMFFTHQNGVNGIVSNCTFDNGSGGLSCGGPKNTLIGNVITNISTSACIALAFDGSRDSVVSGNNCEGVSGITATGADDNTHSLLVIGNTCTGVAIDSGTIGAGMTINDPNSVVQGNVIRNHSHGIRVNGDGAVVRGNTVIDTTNSTGATPFGIRVLDGTGVIVEGNSVFAPISMTMTNCILIDAAATNTKLINNDLADSQGPEIADNGTGTQELNNIEDNVIQGMRISSTTALANISDPINTTNKRRDELILNSATEKVLRASSNTAGAIWVTTDGLSSVIPI